jgi:phosphonate transport system substrate-binding protein
MRSLVLAALVPLACATSSPEAGKPAPAAAAPAPLRVGLTMPQGAQAATTGGERLAAYLQAAMGRQVSARVVADSDTLAAALAKGEVDAAWMPPFSYVKAVPSGARALAKALRHGLPFYRAVLFVKADSKAKTLADSKGGKMAWVDKGSAAGWVFPRALLAQAKLDPATLFKEQRFLGTHEAVCKAVQSGQSDVGATLADDVPGSRDLKVTGCKASLGADADKLRVLAASSPIPNDVVAVRKDLDPATADALHGLLLDLAGSPAGRALLADVFSADGMADVGDADFEPVKEALKALETAK